MIPLDPYEREFIFILLWIHFLSLLIGIFFYKQVSLRASRGELKRSFLRVHLFILIWLIGKILKTVSPTLPLRWWSNVLYYLGVLPLGAGLFILSRALTGKVLKPWIKKVIYVPSLIFLIFLISNPKHYLFYSTYNFIRDRFGPLFYIHFGVTYIFALLTVVTLIRAAIKNRKETLKATSLLLGALIPLVINLNYILDIYNPMFDTTPIVYNFTLIILGFAAFRLDFFNFIPNPVQRALEQLPGSTRLNSIYYSTKGEGEYKTRSYSIYVKNKKIEVERSVNIDTILRDTEELKKVLKETTIKNRELQIELEERVEYYKAEERIKLAGEIHDILGYSISSLISILEMIRINNFRGDRYRESIKRAITLVDNGINDLNNSVKASDSKGKQKFLKLISECELLNLDITLIQRSNIPLGDNLYLLFYKILKEAVTNIIKYSSATEITVAITPLSGNLLFNIIDNGKGCSTIVEGNGLDNIRRRVSQFQGECNFYSNKGTGFQISIIIPLPGGVGRVENPVQIGSVGG